MLDFSRLVTPPADGDVLVVPEPASCAAAARANSKQLDTAQVKIAGTPLCELRAMTRKRFLGECELPVIVTGHQPAFIHPGVWAKHVVSQRLACALDGRAVNLVVDNDAPNETTLTIPTVDGDDVSLSKVSFAALPAGQAYEQIPLHTPNEIDTFERGLRSAAVGRFESTLLPMFISGFRSGADSADWVDQAIAGRRAIEAPFGVDLLDRRVSRFCWEPLLVEIVTNAERFCASYNAALAKYRRMHRIRGNKRPVPDLAVDGERCELPIWAYRPNEARRRVFATNNGDRIRLDADGDEFAQVPASALGDCDDWPRQPGSAAGWMLRPRALTLTLWARLFLADLFVHGIGGAKYDRITDLLIADYFKITPPTMACVSATLWMDLPRCDVTPEQIRRKTHALRDLRWNPQRHLAKSDAELSLVRDRAAAVASSRSLRKNSPGDGVSRRAVFEEIRQINRKLSGFVAARSARYADELSETRNRFRMGEIGRRRDFFFGLYAATNLQRLTDALPAQRSFRV